MSTKKLWSGFTVGHGTDEYGDTADFVRVPHQLVGLFEQVDGGGSQHRRFGNEVFCDTCATRLNFDDLDLFVVEESGFEEDTCKLCNK